MQRILTLVLASALCACASKNVSITSNECESTREFVTTLQYLRDNSALSLGEPEARGLAEKVSGGCTGAADRFISVVKTLGVAGLGGREAAQIAVRYARASDEQAETFLSVFKHAFSSDALDLDLRLSVDVASQLSSGFNGSSLQAKEDFERFVDFCLAQEKMNLPRPTCAPIAAKLTKKGEAYGKSVFPSFERLFEFLKSEKGGGLTANDVLRTTESVVELSPSAADNFILGYRFGVSKQGLGLSAADALAFAKRMAAKTAKTEAPTATPEQNRK
jgi:hypothetical protein